MLFKIRIVLTLAFLLTGFLLFSLPVDKKLAIEVAQSFYLQHHPNPLKNATVSFVQPLLHSKTGSVYLYAVNFSDTGFVLIAGDNSLSPVFGYSYSSFFTGENKPFQLNGLLEEYENLFYHVTSMEPQLSIEKQSEWNQLLYSKTYKGSRAIVDALIPCFWDQGALYNMLCPDDPQGPGGKVYAGCVATAMSMIMYYFRYPETGQGQHGYYSDYGYLFVDFSQSQYVWNNMPVKLTGKNYPVAKLMYDAGVAVNMMYSPNGSGAYMDDAANAMIEHFKYSPTLSLVYRDNYTFNEWVNLLKGQLNQGYPMMYAGFGSNGPGHAFVCDGYDSGNLFHFNWGWSGAYNGFYVMDYLTPGGYTFSNWQQAVINCFPADNNYPYGCQGLTIVNGTNGTITDGSGPANYANNSNCSWLIQPEILTEKITLQFHRLNTEAAADLVCVYAGPDNSFPLIGCFSGNTLPQSLTHNGGSMFITFQSNSMNTDKGFFVEYFTIPMKFCESMTILTAPSGTIEDGSGTHPYQPGTICRWMINPPNAGAIVFEFEEFDLEQDNDFIVLLDNSTFPSTEIVRFSGQQIPDTYVYHGSPVILMFKTDDFQQHNGWKINYSTWATSVENHIQQKTAVFPNPFNEYLTVNNINNQKRIRLSDLSGRIIADFHSESTGETFSISTKHLSDGIYILQTGEGEDSETFKIVKLSH